MMGDTGFLLAVITSPGDIPGELEYLEGLLEAGVEKLHLRKPGGTVEGLLERLALRWASRLVVHGRVELALRYGVPQVHGSAGMLAGPAERGGDAGSLAVSTSVHSWGELKQLPAGLAYAFISPVFDSISKPGYMAAADLLTMPSAALPCRPVGMGGVSADTIGLMTTRGWTGAALMGWIWEEPREAVKRFEQIKKLIDGQAERIGGSGI
jgi:thiamine-phosphate pyrophosphorylase